MAVGWHNSTWVVAAVVEQWIAQDDRPLDLEVERSYVVGPCDTAGVVEAYCMTEHNDSEGYTADWEEEARLAAGFDQGTAQRLAGSSLHNRYIASVVVGVAVGELRGLRMPFRGWQRANLEVQSSDERLRPESQE